MDIVNPNTGRKIKLGSKTYRKLVIEGIIVPRVVPLEQEPPVPLKPVEIKVRNPQTGYLISKTGALYKKLIKAGVVFNDDVNRPIPQIIISPAKRPNCINAETYVLQVPTADIDADDLLTTPSGHCFSVKEIISWINSKTYANKHPYVTDTDLFGPNYKTTYAKYPTLIQALNDYFAHNKAGNDLVIDTLHANLDILYLFGATGSICYYDQIYSHDADDSSNFEYSIYALSELSAAIEGLPANVRNIIYDMKLLNGGIYNIKNLINDANTGNRCIHGVGSMLLMSFVHYFLCIEAKHNITYEPIRCGMYFVEQNNAIVLYNMENRLINNSFTQFIKPLFANKNKSTSLIWNMAQTRINPKALSADYNKVCQNEAYMATLNTVDTWQELEDWRKIMIDTFCFDILFLIKTITDQLNTNSGSNPAPVYPNNIFTRKPLTTGQLLHVRRRIRNNYFKVSDVLTTFLNNSDSLWSDDIAYAQSAAWRNVCINFFERDLRVVRYLSSRDGVAGGSYTILGYWNRRTFIEHNSESVILRYLATMVVTTSLKNLALHQFKLSDYISGFNITNKNLEHGYNDFNQLI
jgi:hypothetical protein